MGNLRKELNGEPLWGLPEHFSEDLINAYEITAFRWLGHWLFMIIMCLGFAVGGFWLWPYLEQLNIQRAMERTTDLNGLMFDVNFGIGLLIGLFVWIFLTGALSMALVRLAPMPLKGSLFFGVSADLDKTGIKRQQNIDALMKGVDRPNSTAELINRLTEPNIKKAFKIFIPIAILTALITYRETYTFSVLSETGHYRSGFFSNSSQSWNEVSSVELGCNHVTGKNRSDDLVYKIKFRQGKALGIDDAIPLQGSWLENAKKINAKLKENGTQFKRWKWLNRDPLHPKCLAAQQNSYTGVEFNQIVSLLQIGNFTTDSNADIGAAHYSSGEFAKAIESYSTAIQEASNSTDYITLAKLYFDRAEAKYSLNISLLPDDRAFFDALADYSKAIELNSQDAFYFRERGSVFAILGDYDRAFADFATMSRIEGNDPYWSMVRTGGLYRQLGEFDNAMKAFGKASLRWEPTMPLNYHKAKTYNKFGQYREAIASIEAGLIAQDNYGSAYHTMACSKAMLGQYDEALADYRTGSKLVSSFRRSTTKHFPSVQHDAELHIRNERFLEALTLGTELMTESDTKDLCFGTWWDIHYQSKRDISELLVTKTK